MNDPRERALLSAQRLLDHGRRRALTAAECFELVEAVGIVPGLLRPSVQLFSCQRDGAAVDALLALPSSVPGLVEALYGAFAGGVTRMRVDGSPCFAMLAMDFRRSRSAAFDESLARAAAVFGDGLEQLEVEQRVCYRFAIDSRRGTLAGRAAAIALDVQWLHGKLSKLRGTRLWLNGWCFDEAGTIRPPVQIHLVRGWLTWAARQVHTAVP